MPLANSRMTRQKKPIHELMKEGKSLNKIEEKKKEELAAAVTEAIPPKPEVVIKYKYRIKRVPVEVVKEVLASEQKVLIRIDGELYEPSTELYKGHLIVDINIDSLRRSVDIENSLIDQPVFETSKIEPEQLKINKSQNFWQKIKAKF